MSKKYKNSPIIEAVCDFQFEPGVPWDLTVPGLVYEKIKDTFPRKKQQQQIIFEAKLSPKEGGISQQVQTKPGRMQFFNENESALVQVGENLLAINCLKPYPTWGQFLPIIQNNLQVYRDIAEPKGFKRIGIRYINKITVPKQAIMHLDEYFCFYPRVPDDIPNVQDRFISQLEIPYKNERDLVTLKFGSTQPEEPDTLAFLLDIDYVLVVSQGISIDQVDDWIDHAHNVIEDTFEACITDRCRSLFGGKK